MGIETFSNATGLANFVLAVNHESSGILLTGLLFVLFIIVAISMLQGAGRDIWETMAFSGFGTFIPTLLATTLYFQGIQAVKFWVVIFFGLIMVIGITGMYFTSKN